jgi:polyisoprenoid-binding protein YceI
VEVRDPKLAGHLLSPDFFDAERYPEITFTSGEIRTDGDELVVPGKLTIKGTTNDVESRGTLVGPVEYLAGGERVGIDLETAVDRTEYGLSWNAALPRGGVAVENEVTLTVHLELTRAE